MAADAVKVVADGLHWAGLAVRVLKAGRPLHSPVPDTVPAVAAPDPVTDPEADGGPPSVVVVPRPLGPADERVLTRIPRTRWSSPRASPGTRAGSGGRVRTGPWTPGRWT